VLLAVLDFFANCTFSHFFPAIIKSKLYNKIVHAVKKLPFYEPLSYINLIFVEDTVFKGISLIYCHLLMTLKPEFSNSK
jgi:hypothetical protein